METDTSLKPHKQQGSGINPQNLQEVLESGTNAKNKGQSQWSSPIDFAKIVCIPLPAERPCITDLNAGPGQLLVGAANKTTRFLLANDIENCRTVKAPATSNYAVSRIQSDICKLFPLLREVQAEFDLFVLNPPWDVHWHQESLALLAESELYSVKLAWKARDPRLPAGKTIDSTVATLMIALDLMTARGEGVLIANESTLQRLIFKHDAPYRALACHVWQHLVIAGNPMTGIDGHQWEDNGFQTGVIYFARAHQDGCYAPGEPAKTQAEFKETVQAMNRFRNRHGIDLGYSYHANGDSHGLWQACKDEYNALQGVKGHNSYNIWLKEDGTIGTMLSVFETHSGKVDKEAAERLFKLAGMRPLQLVMQSAQRAELLKAVNGGTWRVDPKLPALVAECVTSYNAVRAPLYPLSPIQSLGYLDESDHIKCRKDLFKDGKLLFKAGKTYELRTETVKVERTKFRPSLTYGDEEFLMSGQELAIHITGEEAKPANAKQAREWSRFPSTKPDTTKEYCFMDGKHMAKGVKITGGVTADLTLQDIASHFDIPQVPDVAEVHPERFNAKLEILRRIEVKLERIGFKFKKFQNGDYSRCALHDGAILSHDTGLGKSVAAYILPVLWLDMDDSKQGIMPNGKVLIVAPEHLHQQLMNEAYDKFGIVPTKLNSQDDYYALSPMPNGYYMTSYTQLASNKIAKMVDPFIPDSEVNTTKLAEFMHFFNVTVEQAQKSVAMKDKINLATGNVTLVPMNTAEKALKLCRDQWVAWNDGMGKVVKGIKCLYSPSLADLCEKDFDVVVIDEATKIKGETTIVGCGVRQMKPRYRLVLTATPIKNRLPDIFWLAWWATGGNAEAHPRWPYTSEAGQQDAFASEFLVCERNLSKERAENGGKEKPLSKKRKGKTTAEVCNVHRMWKLIAPVVLRRRKQDIGEDIVAKLRHVIRAPMGKKQADVYEFHLNAPYIDKNGQPALMAKLQALRSVAAAPQSPLLHNVGKGMVFDEDSGDVVVDRVIEAKGMFRSDTEYIPKIAAALTVIEQVIRRGEQVVVFNAFHEPTDCVARRLSMAGIPFDVLDGRKNGVVRGNLSAQFKKGRPHAKPVMLAGINAMAQGHSWNLANNVILLSFDWAYDLFEQGINRVHRLNSVKDVNVYPIICEGSIDRKLESMIAEKGDSAELVLDGQLLGEKAHELTTWELLKIAEAEFRSAKTYCEAKLEQEWPALKLKLQEAYQESEWELARSVETVSAQPARLEQPATSNMRALVNAVSAPLSQLLSARSSAVWRFA
jgi:SNF2 family DNA or RNA helicase